MRKIPTAGYAIVAALISSITVSSLARSHGWSFERAIGVHDAYVLAILVLITAGLCVVALGKVPTGKDRSS